MKPEPTARRAALGLIVLLLLPYGLSATGAAAATYRSKSGHSSPKWIVSTRRPIDPGTGASFASIACPTVSGCFAVGSQNTKTGPDRTLTEGLVSSGWTLVPSPNQGSSDNDLYSVSCGSQTECVAVGASTDSQEYSQTLAELLIYSSTSGGWSIMATPNDATTSRTLEGVDCVSASWCMAVGYSKVTSSNEQTLTEQWNGQTWSIIPSANKGAKPNILGSIWCSSPTACIAVGKDGSSSPLAEQWNGSDWSILTTASAAPGSNFTSLSCTAPSSCMAVGTSADGGFAEQLRGSTWTVLAYFDNNPGGVSCVSARSCASVGGSLAHWDGSSWSFPLAMPRGVGTSASLGGVVCTRSLSGCIAVGAKGQKPLVLEGTG
jgi:hypothetical protein